MLSSTVAYNGEGVRGKLPPLHHIASPSLPTPPPQKKKGPIQNIKKKKKKDK